MQLDPWSEAVIRALDAAKPAVVHLSVSDLREGTVHVGSGVVLDSYHVVAAAQLVETEEGAEPPQVQFKTADGHKYNATIEGIDPLYHLAVLRSSSGRMLIERPSWANSDEAVAGTVCLTVGNPWGTDHTVAMGLISAPERTIYRSPERWPVDGLMVTDSAIHAGNSGGALVRLSDGKVIGVNGSGIAPGISYAVQSNVVARVANQIIEYGQATHPWLGFGGQPEIIDPAMASLLDLPVREGLLVQYVADRGPGMRAGVQVMDLVVKVKDRPVNHVGAVRKLLALHRPGDRVSVTVFRKGELITLSFPVEQMPKLYGRE